MMAYISFKDVSFAYPDGFTALEGVSLEIEEGEKLALIGKNGAGKTTAAKLMNGLLKPGSGTVTVGGMDTRDHTPARTSRTVGYVFQNPDDQIFHSSVLAEVDFGPRILKIDRAKRKILVDRALELTGLDAQRDTNPYDLPLSARKFVAVAAVMATDCPVMIFDEPTAGQDLEGARRLSRIIDELHGGGKTVVTITHDMEFVAERFPRVVVMAGGRVAASGAPREIFRDPGMLEAAGLSPPFPSRICRRLGIPGDIIRMDEAVDAILKQIQNHQRSF